MHSARRAAVFLAPRNSSGATSLLIQARRRNPKRRLELQMHDTL